MSKNEEKATPTEKKEPVIMVLDENGKPVKGSLVRQAINRVMAEVGTVAKDGTNEFHKYKYATAADVAFALQKKMAEAGLIITQTEAKVDVFMEAIVTVNYDFELSHISGDVLPEKIRKTGVATLKNSKGGYDDKAVNKCSTAALKYFVIGLFMIPTGEYDDADKDEDRSAPKSAAKTATTGKKADATPAQQEEPASEDTGDVKPPHDPKTGEVLPPHKIEVPYTNGVGDPVRWSKIYIAALKTSATKEILDAWVKANAHLMSQLMDYEKKSHAAVNAVLNELRENIGKPPAEAKA